MVDVYSDYREYLLVTYGLADEIVDDHYNHYLRFGDDFRDAVTPLISEVMNDMMVHCRVTIESYVEGLANLYGQVSRRQVKETLVRFHQARDLDAAEKVLSMTHLMSVLLSWMGFESAGLTEEPTDDRFILPIERDHDQERQRLLRRLLSPFLLRRTKDDVLNELPEKTEITLRVELSAEEQALYDNLRQQAIANLEEGSKSVLQTLAEITRLRQAACHPRLIDAKLPLKSSKTQAFLELVEELWQSGHRALVFSQFTSHLALIREALDRQFDPDGNLRSPDYLYLDGSTSPAERNRLVRQFQTGSEPLFLISLKAGGLGLNLTAADYVIHLDPWWNPAVEDQASDRAHRIGQERPVTVYRLISAGTIEEKIIRLHQNKRSLVDALLEDADMFSQISAADVIRLLREGVDAIN